VRNMPGSGGLTMANHIANIGAKDGTIVGISQSTIAFEGLLHLVSAGGKAAQFEADKLTWIGSAAQSTFLVAAWHTAKAKSFADLATTELILGSSGLNTDGALITAALDKVLGTKIRLVPGFQSGSGQVLALERGEIDAAALEYSTISAMRPDWIRDGKLRFLVQCGLRRLVDLPDVPFALDYVKSPEDRQVLELIFSKYQFGRPYVAAPGIPANRATALRSAFDQAMKDPALLAEAQKQHLNISPMSGIEVQTMVEQLYRTPQSVKERAREILGGK
jgi:tripartite-type tricarboxylate transporter receptor subunit TctC